ncbi:hypothetical protein [Aromatoleum diolicum]|uniref:Transposase n=1 Tax=Aromatoleum diolicum TaxID=75796 RepID=A0ABX1Q9H4_9RHOO|nr:hypothetical protein [Aromatoleum diolicum]NMG74685.1 hypothetical protein [Aromatoleum diolicum]
MARGSTRRRWPSSKLHEVRGLVASVLRRVQAEEPASCALETGNELVRRRFQIVENRLTEAAVRRRAENVAEVARSTAKLTGYPGSFETALKCVAVENST